MTITELGSQPEKPLTLIEQIAAEFGLEVVDFSSDREYHLHLKKPKLSGTLEFSWDSNTGRMWLKQHPRRLAPWHDEVIGAIQKRLTPP